MSRYRRAPTQRDTFREEVCLESRTRAPHPIAKSRVIVAEVGIPVPFNSARDDGGLRVSRRKTRPSRTPILSLSPHPFLSFFSLLLSLALCFFVRSYYSFLLFPSRVLLPLLRRLLYSISTSFPRSTDCFRIVESWERLAQVGSRSLAPDERYSNTDSNRQSSHRCSCMRR